MTNDLYRIVYCSRNLILDETAPAPVEAELQRILAASRRNNTAADVTGALLFNRDYFAQVLEGPRKSVETTFERIQQDRRHGEVTMVENGWATNRDFPDWAMAHAEPATDQEAQGIAATLNLALLTPSENGAGVLHLLKDLVAQD